MTTLSIEIPDEALVDILSFVKAKGGNILNTDPNEDNLTKAEFESLKRGLNEALLIKSGKIKSKPLSELWNE